MNDKVEKVLEERGAVYGPNPFNQETVGDAWKALLESHYQQKLPGPIPGHIVGLMMVVLKVMRAATPFGYHEDNYIDMHGYTEVAHKCRKVEDENTNDGSR